MPRADSDEEAFTGLGAAIVFIAFIVVAAVFAYVVLGVGMTTSQKSQETMHAALGEAGSVLRPGYAVIAKLEGGPVRFVEFDIETATDLAVIDTGSMTYSVATKKTLVTFPPGDSRVTVTWRHRKDAGDLLEAGEVATVHIEVGAAGIRRGDAFTLEMIAAAGAAAALTRTVPAGVGENVYLELF